MKNSANVFLSVAFAGLLLGGCKKNPIDRLTNPLPDGDVPQTSGIYVIYDDELKTAGGLALIPGPENQTVNFNDQSSPRRTTSQMKYVWNGQDVTENGAIQHLFAGFQLLISPDQASLPSTPPRNLSAPGYTRLTLYIRGSLSLNTALRIEGPDDGTGGITPARTELTSLSSDWTQVSLTIPSADFVSVKTFLTLSFQYTQPPFTTAPGEGGVVFLDDIRYEQ